MLFPHNDLYWVDTVKYVKEYINQERLLAPDEFTQEFTEAYSYSANFSKERFDFQWVIIHKGRMEQLGYRFLKLIRKELTPVFANEVFIVFSNRDDIPRLDSNDVHLKYFNDQLELSISVATIETDSRRKCQTVYLGDGTILCRVLGKYIFYVDAEDIGITPHLCLDGFWETWITVTMIRVLEPGWNCIDVGANHGYYSTIMADAVGSTGRVLAIEPNPKLASMMKRTLEVNGFQKYAIVLQKAMSDVNAKIAKLVIPRSRGINASLCRDITTEDEVVEVETVTLDEIAKDWSRVDFVKVDAEGMEEAIWYGMRDTVRKNPSITIIMEFNCSRYLDPKVFLQDIQSAGFLLQHIDFDSQIKRLTIEQCLSERLNEDWMLFLKQDC